MKIMEKNAPKENKAEEQVFEMPEFKDPFQDMNFDFSQNFNFDFDIKMPEMDSFSDFDFGSFDSAIPSQTEKTADFNFDFDFGSFDQDFKIEMPDISSFTFDFGAMPGMDFAEEATKAAQDASKELKQHERGIEKERRQIKLATSQKQIVIVVRDFAAKLSGKFQQALESFTSVFSELKGRLSTVKESRPQPSGAADREAKSKKDIAARELRKLENQAAWIARMDSIKQHAVLQKVSYAYYTWAVVWDQLDEEKRLRKIDKETELHNKGLLN